jgi:hypothetical protein
MKKKSNTIERRQSVIKTENVLLDDLYRISDKDGLDPLNSSISSIGLLAPLVVEKIGNEQYRLVTGFRRFECIKKLEIDLIPVLINEAVKNPLELFHLAINDNLAIRKFTPIEVSTIINKLEKDFSVDKQMIVTSFLPLLGFGKNPRIYELYKPIIELSAEWKHAIKNESVALETAFMMINVGAEDSQNFLELVLDLRLGKNRQKEFWGLLLDVARMRNISVFDLVQSKDLNNIVKDEKLTCSQKADRYKKFLWQNRYPKYSQVKQQFESLLSQAKLPQEITIHPPPFFEGEKYNMQLLFNSQKDLDKKIAAVKKAIENNIIDKITNLT